jgi:hypothetical protein
MNATTPLLGNGGRTQLNLRAQSNPILVLLDSGRPKKELTTLTSAIAWRHRTVNQSEEPVHTCDPRIDWIDLQS